MLNILAFVTSLIIIFSAGYVYGQKQAQPEIERSAVINYVMSQLIPEENQ